MLYGKKRHLARDYYNLAMAGKWDEARVKWAGLNDVREYYHELFIWEIARSATYAGSLANIKAWYEAIGLRAGPIRPPVPDVTPQKKEEIKAKLASMGIA